MENKYTKKDLEFVAVELNKVLALEPPIDIGNDINIKFLKEDIIDVFKHTLEESDILSEETEKIMDMLGLVRSVKGDKKAEKPKIDKAEKPKKKNIKKVDNKEIKKSVRYIISNIINDNKYNEEKVFKEAEKQNIKSGLVKMYLTAWKKGDRTPFNKNKLIINNNICEFI